MSVGHDNGAELGSDRHRVGDHEPSPTPIVITTTLHMRPSVISVTRSRASCNEVAVWVAPKSPAFSRLNSTGSMATMLRAPRAARPGQRSTRDLHTDDSDGVAGLHSSCSHCRAPPGDHATAQETCHLERDVALERDATVFVHDGVAGERADAAHQCQVLATCMMARCAIGDLQTCAHRLSAIAQPRSTVRTTRAMAADRHEVEDHGVTDRKSRDARPDFSDDACALVPTHDRHRPGHVARDEVIVGVAHAGGVQARL